MEARGYTLALHGGKMFNPYTYPIKGDISRADAVVLYEEASKTPGTITEFGPGGSTIFLAMSGRVVTTYEHDEKWLNKIKENIKAYSVQFRKYCTPKVLVNKIDYSDKRAVDMAVVDATTMSRFFYIDGKREYRKIVMDHVLKQATPGTVVLYHDCYSLEHQETFFKMAQKYFSKIDRIDFKYRKSNMMRLVVGEERKYENWNNTEASNHRVPWNSDRIK